jgi:endonuclease YncB( thermonuclease family)
MEIPQMSAVTSHSFGRFLIRSIVASFALPVLATATSFTGTLQNIVDGDTVHVTDGAGKLVKVRYLGMDAPELHFQNKSQGKWGALASERLHAMMNAQSAKTDRSGRITRSTVDRTTKKAIKVEVTLEGQDKYGRSLGYVKYGNTITNLEMVRTGWAVPYLYCARGECDAQWFIKAHVADYVAACETASSQKAGIFDAADPLEQTPDEFRRAEDGRAPYQYIGDFQTKKLYRPENGDSVEWCQRIRFEKEADAIALGYQY